MSIHRQKMSISTRILRIVIVLILVEMVVTVVYPLLWMVLGGFKTTTELLTSPFSLPAKWKFSNYTHIWKSGIQTYFLNSLFITICSSALVAVISAFAAFALSRYRFKCRYFVFIYLIGGMMLAPQVSLISNYKILQGLGLYDTRFGLICAYTAFRIPYTTFLMWSYFSTLPKDMEEAATIDGCSSFQIFLRILLPLSKPILSTGILLTIRYVWNDFLFSMVFTQSAKLRTIPYGLNALKSETGTEWSLLLAGMVLSAIPLVVLFLFTQKSFVRGLTGGAIKE